MPSLRWSSSSGGSSERAGSATVGKVVPPDGHDLSAEPLKWVYLAQAARRRCGRVRSAESFCGLIRLPARSGTVGNAYRHLGRVSLYRRLDHRIAHEYPLTDKPVDEHVGVFKVADLSPNTSSMLSSVGMAEPPDQLANLRAARACAFAASTSRFLGGALV